MTPPLPLLLTHGLLLFACCCFGAWVLLLVTNNNNQPWVVGVGIVGVCLGICIAENRDLNDELNKMQDELIENDRLIVELQSTVNKMVLRMGELEGGYTRRDKFRSSYGEQRLWKSMSSSSL
jgi:hypothetical protein